MLYDLEVTIPVCGRFLSRLDDYKKYGLVNIKDRKVLINLIISGEDLEGLEKGWDSNVSVNLVKNLDSDYVKNMYKFYLTIDPDKISSRWFIRLDDDSCTDVDGLVSNLDLFYSCDRPYYLGHLNDFHNALMGEEGQIYPQYKHLLEEYSSFASLLKNEVECAVLSRTALSNILKDEKAYRLLKFRAGLEGGYTDTVLAISSAIAKIYPIDCPFITYLPLINEFSLVGGVRNHIHLVRRTTEGENFTNIVSMDGYDVLTRIVDNKITDLEMSILGNRYMLETHRYIRTYEFAENHQVICKFDHRKLLWLEKDGLIVVLDGGNLAFKLQMQGDDLLGENTDAEEDWEKNVLLKCISKVNKPMLA
jgi:hypothetical protein